MIDQLRAISLSQSDHAWSTCMLIYVMAGSTYFRAICPSDSSTFEAMV